MVNITRKIVLVLGILIGAGVTVAYFLFPGSITMFIINPIRDTTLFLVTWILLAPFHVAVGATIASIIAILITKGYLGSIRWGARKASEPFQTQPTYQHPQAIAAATGTTQPAQQITQPQIEEKPK